MANGHTQVDYDVVVVVGIGSSSCWEKIIIIMWQKIWPRWLYLRSCSWCCGGGCGYWQHWLHWQPIEKEKKTGLIMGSDSPPVCITLCCGWDLQLAAVVKVGLLANGGGAIKEEKRVDRRQQ